MVLWSKENVLSLIKDYSQNKQLWDWDNERYNDRAERQQIFQNLAEKYDTDVPTLKAKLNTLRSSFFQEHKRIKKLVAAKMSYKPWYAYKYLAFLKNYKVRPPFLSTRLSKNNYLSSALATTSGNEANNKEPNVRISIQKCGEQNVIPSDDNNDDHVKIDDNDGENMGDGGEIENISEEDAEVAAIMPDIPNNAIYELPAQQENKEGHRRNENSSFGKYIGKEIEKLSPSTQMFTKCVLQYTIYEASSGRLKDTFNAHQQFNDK